MADFTRVDQSEIYEDSMRTNRLSLSIRNLYYSHNEVMYGVQDKIYSVEYSVQWEVKSVRTPVHADIKGRGASTYCRNGRIQLLNHMTFRRVTLDLMTKQVNCN